MFGQPKFELGQVVITPGAQEAVLSTNTIIVRYLQRYAGGDWGTVCDEDKQANDYAVANEERILGAYDLVDGTKIWIITEWDRSVTTILLPEEY